VHGRVNFLDRHILAKQYQIGIIHLEQCDIKIVQQIIEGFCRNIDEMGLRLDARSPDRKTCTA